MDRYLPPLSDVATPDPVKPCLPLVLPLFPFRLHSITLSIGRRLYFPWWVWWYLWIGFLLPYPFIPPLLLYAKILSVFSSFDQSQPVIGRNGFILVVGPEKNRFRVVCGKVVP